MKDGETCKPLHSSPVMESILGLRATGLFPYSSLLSLELVRDLLLFGLVRDIAALRANSFAYSLVLSIFFKYL